MYLYNYIFHRYLKWLEKEKIRDSNHSTNFRIVDFFGTDHVLQILLEFFHKVNFFLWLIRIELT